MRPLVERLPACPYLGGATTLHRRGLPWLSGCYQADSARPLQSIHRQYCIYLMGRRSALASQLVRDNARRRGYHALRNRLRLDHARSPQAEQAGEIDARDYTPNRNGR